MNFDVLSFILGKRGDGGPIRDIVSYLMGKLVGFITEVVNDVYEELRSAPIHTSITIDGNVYPRVDNTRLGLETIKGRTVAFNQLFNYAIQAEDMTTVGIHRTKSGGVFTFGGTSTASGYTLLDVSANIVSGHKYAIIHNGTITGMGHYIFNAFAMKYNFNSTIAEATSDYYGLIMQHFVGSADVAVSGSTAILVIDLTLMFGSTIADSIYAMEQATPGAGVAYVRQRLPLDYYAYNAGTLTAPVVSGWSVTDTDEQTTTLPIPSTTLNGVGTAQDYIEAVEVGENDYSLIKHTLMGEADLGDLNFSYSDTRVAFNDGLPNADTASVNNVICSKYPYGGAVSSASQIASMPDKQMYRQSGSTQLFIKDSAYTDATAFKTAVTGQKLVYQLATPTEITIAEHLTLAEVSAIAQNGGIIGIVNSNGGIVQPDLTVTTVISKSITAN